MRTRRRAVRVALRACRAPLASHRISLGGKRKMYEAFTAVPRPPGGTRYERLTIAGVPVLRLRPPADVAAGTRSLIEEQVRNGVAVRMALLYLLAGVRG